MPVKRLALILSFAWSLFGASPTYVKTVCSAANAGSCSGNPQTIGDLIVVSVGNGKSGGNTVTTITGGGTTYTASPADCGDTNSHFSQWYGYAASTGSVSFAVTWSGGQYYTNIIVVEYAGATASSPVDPGGASHTCAASSGSGSVNLGGGSVTTTVSGEIIVCGIYSVSSSETFTLGTSYSDLVQITGGYSSATEDRGVASAGSYTTTITKSQGDNWSGGCATYKAPSADYSLSGPSSGYIHTASTNFTITNLTGNWTSTPKTITISDGGNSGTVTGAGSGCGSSGTTPYGLSLTSGTACTFTYTAAVLGSLTLTSAINSGTDPAPNTYGYTSSGWTSAFSGCSSGNLRVASATCTVTLTGGTFDGAHTVTLSDGGNLGTFTSGSSGNPLTVTPTAASSSFTFTYTPYLVGQKTISATTNQSYWQAPSSFLYTSSSTDVCTFTAQANGNWNSAGTWTASGGCGHTTPDTGDSVTITAHHVTIPAGIVAYSGSCPANNTTYDLQIAPTATTDATSGVLEVAGTFWLCGNVKLNASAVANPVGFGIFQIDTGGALQWDLNNGSTAYHLVPGVTGGWNQLIVGTLGDTCTFATESCPTSILPINVGSANPVLVDVNGTTDSMTYQIYGMLVRNCGSASIGCLNYATDGNTGRNSYANAGLVDVEGSVLDATGTFQATCAYAACNPVASFTFLENRFVGDLQGFITNGGRSASTKPCLFVDNYFSAVFANNSNATYTGCTFTGNVFAQAVYWANSDAWPLAMFQGDVALAPMNDRSAANLLPVRNNYFAWPVAGSSMHNLALGGGANSTYQGNVHESLDSSQGEGHCTTGGSAAPAANHLYFLDNLSLPAPNGANSCSLASQEGTVGGSAVQVARIEHNGAFGNGVYQWFALEGHSGNYYYTNQAIRSLRANLGYSPTSGAQNLMVGPNALETAGRNAMPNTVVYVAQEGGNALYNAAASTDWGPGNGNSGCNSTQSGAYGTAYDQCTASGATVPGMADITANPNLVDHTRGLLTWASRLHGKAATLGGAESALIGCQNLGWCTTELLNWVKRGYQPTNLALKGKAYDGRIVGFAGTYGSGYPTGTCAVTFTNADTDDLGSGAVATCSFTGGVPSVQITNPGTHYRFATPAVIAITSSGGAPSVAASLAPVISPHDIGPVQMALVPGAM